MNLNGSYVWLHKSSSPASVLHTTWHIPYDGQNTMSVSNNYNQPIKLAYEALQDVLVSAAGDIANVGGFGTTGAKTAKGLQFLTDTLGIKIFSKGYYAQAWTGSEPATFSLKLKFFRGMKNKWDAKEEVYTPITEIMALVVPYNTVTGSNALLTAPGPNALQCFSVFAADIATLGLTSLTSSATTGTKTAGTPIVESSAIKVTGKAVLNTLMGGGTWQVGFGWFDGSNKGIKTYLSYSQLNITQATYSFSNIMEKNDKDISYPISGEMDLTFKAQNIFSSDDFIRNYNEDRSNQLGAKTG